MRTIDIVALGCALFTCSAFGQDKLPATVIERGPNHKVLERIRTVTLADGGVREEKSVTTQLGAGLCYRDPQTGDLRDSRAVISPDPNGAIAHEGQVQCAFASDLATRGALQIVAGDVQISGHVLGLALTDAATGRSFMIANVQSSQGVIDSESSITYPNMLDTISCNLTYHYRTWGVEQDLTFLGPLNFTPEELGMQSATTRLELFFEVLDNPAEVSKQVPIKSVLGAEQVQLAMGAFTDSELAFGPLHFVKGKAFAAQGLLRSVPIGKSFIQTADNRKCLVETIEYPAIQPALARLGKLQAAVKKQPRQLAPGQAKPAQGTLLARALPPAPKTAGPGERHPMGREVNMAMVPKERADSWTWDFVVQLASGLTNYTFRGDYTYWITGPVSVYGATNRISGGAIFKYEPLVSNAGLYFAGGTLLCDTTPAFPAIFTYNSDPVGDDVESGATGDYYGNIALRGESVMGDLHDMRFIGLSEAINWYGATNRFSNLQFINCDNGMEVVYPGNVASVHNILGYSINSALFLGSAATINAQHVTAYGVGALTSSSDDYLNFTITNSILYGVGSLGTAIQVAADYIATNTSLSITGITHSIALTNFPFQTVRGGAFYLATNSTYLRNSGTTNISPTLLRELALATTYAPIYYTNTIQTTQTWLPVAQRDSDVPDYGYHYTPIDYIVSGLTINTNGLLILTNGVSVAFDYGNSSWGFIFDTCKLVSEGSPTRPNRVVRAHCIQEGFNGNPGTRAIFYDKGESGTHGNSEARFRFTEINQMAQDGYSIYTGKNFSAFESSHCILNNMVFIVAATKGSQVYGFTNNIAEWSSFSFNPSSTNSVIHVRNNLFRNGRLDFFTLTNTSTAMDNILDTTDSFDHGGAVSNGWNAYFATTNYLTGGVSNTNLVTLTYQTGPLGKYYQPSSSPLIDRGSVTNAGLIGFYHWTSSTNQVKETNSVLNIGNHYVALSANGQPIDSDNDALPDYYEDRNGNGVEDSGETGWITVDSDYDGRNDGQESVDGTDPLSASSVLPVTLGRWRFDATNWIGDAGQLPVYTNGARSAPSWSSNAVEIGANNLCGIRYRDVETNAAANINVRNGSVSLWYKPNWNSTSNLVAGGPGSGSARLIEVGGYGEATGWWGLYLDGGGTTLTFASSLFVTNLESHVTGALAWTSNYWHQIVLTYSPSNSALYVDGQPVATNGTAITWYPTAAMRSTGLSIGFDYFGTQQANGRFDELLTYNYPLLATDILSNYLYGDDDGDGVANIADIQSGDPSQRALSISIENPLNNATIY
jgi:hypothetical protein